MNLQRLLFWKKIRLAAKNSVVWTTVILSLLTRLAAVVGFFYLFNKYANVPMGQIPGWVFFVLFLILAQFIPKDKD